MQFEPRLTVEFGDGSSVDDYRIRGRQVEFRPRCRGDRVLANTGWRQLTKQDICMHLALHTVVGEWLRLRLDQGALRQIQNLRDESPLSKAA